MLWFDRNLSQMSGLLDSPHLEVRMAAGEVIALMLERGRQYDDDYEWEASEQLIDKLRQLATDSHKYRAKKDRKTQRSSFRDILKYVEVSAHSRLGGRKDFKVLTSYNNKGIFH